MIELDGHDYDQIAARFALARTGDPAGRPTVLLAHTVKGKGLSLAEGVHTWHSIVPSAEDFERARQELEPEELELLDSYADSHATTEPRHERPRPTRPRTDAPARRRCGTCGARSWSSSAHSDPRTVVLDGDLANSTKADKFAKAHPDRFFQMGIAEQNLIGAAAGLAVDRVTCRGPRRSPSSSPTGRWTRSGCWWRRATPTSRSSAPTPGLLIGAVGKTHLDVAGPRDHAGDAGHDRAGPGRRRPSCVAMMDWAQAYDGPVYLRLVRDAVPDLFGRRLHVHSGRGPRAPRGGEVPTWRSSPPAPRPLGCWRRPSCSPPRGVAADRDPRAVPEAVRRRGAGGRRRRRSAGRHRRGAHRHRWARRAGRGDSGRYRCRARIERFGLEDVWGESADNDFLLDKHGLSAERVADRVAELVAVHA